MNMAKLKHGREEEQEDGRIDVCACMCTFGGLSASSGITVASFAVLL